MEILGFEQQLGHMLSAVLTAHISLGLRPMFGSAVVRSVVIIWLLWNQLVVVVLFILGPSCVLSSV